MNLVKLCHPDTTGNCLFNPQKTKKRPEKDAFIYLC